MSVASIGTRIELGPARDLPRDSARRAARVEQALASLPGNQSSEPQKSSSAAVDIQRISLAFNKKLQFVVDHQSNQVIVKVIDPETDKVIKELPPEELQRLHNKLKETIGFLFDQRV
ncbi:MAG TPA: flagellar biosynthesis protein FlaG [Treponema sp.]|nr:flagellar biosynthesis protein FlaG [Treponema sp.]